MKVDRKAPRTKLAIVDEANMIHRRLLQRIIETAPIQSRIGSAGFVLDYRWQICYSSTLAK